MAIDITQFHQVFFEESFEGLQIMESGLLELEPGSPDPEQINTIFRAAHSIKGGSGTFGFADIAAFTHHLETLLDEMRSGRRETTLTAIDTLLQAVDCLGEMLRASQVGSPLDQDKVAIHQAALEKMMEDVPHGGDTSGSCGLPVASVTHHDGWQVVFTPHRDIFLSGNDPLRIIRELSELGDLTSEADLRFLPSLNDYNTEECFVSWNLTLTGNIERDQIEEVFAWVEDHCDMVIRPLSEAALSALPPISQADIPEPASSVDVSRDLPAQTAAELPAPTKPETVPSKPEVDSRTAASAPTSIRVDTQKIDQLINLVGELVITQSMLSMLGEHFDMGRLEQLQSGLVQLERHTRDLQESVMNIRMLPISFVFNL